MKISDWWNEFFPYGNVYQRYPGTDRILYENQLWESDRQSHYCSRLMSVPE